VVHGVHARILEVATAARIASRVPWRPVVTTDATTPDVQSVD